MIDKQKTLMMSENLNELLLEARTTQAEFTKLFDWLDGQQNAYMFLAEKDFKRLEGDFKRLMNLYRQLIKVSMEAEQD